MHKGFGLFQLRYNGTKKLNLNGTTFYLHLNAIHSNQLDLLRLPRFNFWTEAGKLQCIYCGSYCVMEWGLFLPLQMILGQVVSHLFKSFLCTQYFFIVSVKGKSEEFIFIDNMKFSQSHRNELQLNSSYQSPYQMSCMHFSSFALGKPQKLISQ